MAMFAAVAPGGKVRHVFRGVRADEHTVAGSGATHMSTYKNGIHPMYMCARFSCDVASIKSRSTYPSTDMGKTDTAI